MSDTERKTDRPSPDTDPEDEGAPLAEDEPIGPRATTGEPEGERDPED